MLPGKSGGQLLIALGRVKQLGQTRNNDQLWMCLVMKVKFDAVKNSVAQESGILDPRIKVNCTWSIRRWKSKHEHLRKSEPKWTAMGEFNLDDHQHSILSHSIFSPLS